jgi:alpha-L-rhamnosidase
VPAWGDAGVFVPWAAYCNYGDTRLIAEHFDAARRWIDWIDSKNPDHLWKNNRHNDYNDWLNGDSLIKDGWPRKGGNIPNEIFATAFFARSTWIVSEMARVLGREDDRKKYAELYLAIRAVFIKNFIGEKAIMPGDTQAGYALALAFDLVPQELRSAAIEHLAANIEKYEWHLSTGFHSTHHAMIQLTEAGHTDIAHRLAANTTFPSWGYSIENGATTIWERWDGYVKGRGFQDPGMNSLNHWALGSVGEWMMRTIIGINPDPAAPGWSHIILAPKPGGGLTHAKGHYRSIHGDIESSWKAGANGATDYQFVIPPNTTARVRLTAKSVERVTESGKALTEVPGINVVRLDPIIGTDEPAVILEVGAGAYKFNVKR